MSLFARSDLMSVSIPQATGGCGAAHSRPVTRGAPAHIWELKCAPCESYLRGEKKPKIIKVVPGDKDRGIPSQMKHVADADPHWSSTPEGAPATPDELDLNRIRAEQGQRQLDTLTAFAALKQSDMKIPAQAQWLIDKIISEIGQQEVGFETVHGTVLCADGHDNAPGSQFCASCGMRMDAKAVIAAAEEPAVIPLTSLHVNTLRKKCRAAGLEDKGSKEVLISRLESVSV